MSARKAFSRGTLPLRALWCCGATAALLGEMFYFQASTCCGIMVRGVKTARHFCRSASFDTYQVSVCKFSRKIEIGGNAFICHLQCPSLHRPQGSSMSERVYSTMHAAVCWRCIVLVCCCCVLVSIGVVSNLSTTNTVEMPGDCLKYTSVSILLPVSLSALCNTF